MWVGVNVGAGEGGKGEGGVGSCPLGDLKREHADVK